MIPGQRVDASAEGPWTELLVTTSKEERDQLIHERWQARMENEFNPLVFVGCHAGACTKVVDDSVIFEGARGAGGLC